MKKQALILIFANGINFLVNFVMSPFLARQLSYTDNGTYGQLNMINGITTILFNLGLVSVVNLLLVENSGKESRVIKNNFWIQGISSLVCGLIIWFVADALSQFYRNSELASYLVLYIPTLIFTNLIGFVIYYYVYLKQTKILAIITVIANLSRIISIFIAVRQSDSLYYIVLYSNFIFLLQLIFYLYFLRKYLVPIQLPDWGFIKYSLRLSLPYLLLSLFSYGILYVNGILVSRELGLEQFAIYRNGAIEIPFLATLYSSITTVAMPEITRLTKEFNIPQLLTLKKRISNTVAALIYPITFFCIFNGDTLMKFYLSDKYLASGIVFSFYSVALLIRINTYNDILTAAKRPVVIIYANFVTFFVGILLSFLFIKFWGVKGAAIAYSISIIFLSLLLVYSTTRFLSVNLFRYFDLKTLAKISIICISLSYLSSLFDFNNLVGLGLIFSIFILVTYFLLLKLKLLEVSLLPTRIFNVLKNLKLV